MAAPTGSAVRLGHFASMALFALFVSLGFAGVVPRRTPAQRVKYAAWSFFLFLAIGIGVAWLMYPASR
jgi:hypothetical protein